MILINREVSEYLIAVHNCLAFLLIIVTMVTDIFIFTPPLLPEVYSEQFYHLNLIRFFPQNRPFFGQFDTVLAGGQWVTFSECLKLCFYQLRYVWGNCWAICKCLSQKQKITALSLMLRFFLRFRQTSLAPCIRSNFWTRGPFGGLKKRKIIRI